jgi:hypothetical protein
LAPRYVASSAPKTPAEPNDNKEFAGKTFSVTAGTSGVVLENVKIAKFGSESFISGTTFTYGGKRLPTHVYLNLRFVTGFAEMSKEHASVLSKQEPPFASPTSHDGATTAQPAPIPPPPDMSGPPVAVAQPLQQLAKAWLRLNTILNGNWLTYLAMPAEVYAACPPATLEAYVPSRPVSGASLEQALDRFDAVARDPNYARLTQRSEFCTTHQLLKNYHAAAPTPALPAPPPTAAKP